MRTGYSEKLDRLSNQVITKFSEPVVHDMGAELKIVELPSYITVEERDLIVKAVREYISKD
jgi:hypothetical protein